MDFLLRYNQLSGYGEDYYNYNNYNSTALRNNKYKRTFTTINEDNPFTFGRGNFIT